ncbi:hypothetical protein BD413DRAFT_185715 [Trametes elegans]|nr:hypothetical protein BD413DRAFT_185715 [Trametes elegans]
MASSSNRPLNRGAACLPCRKLKARCDGNKPACGRCLANNRPDDCEYAVGGEVTRSRLLEENIALLEARIRELENPSEAPSVRLHDPRRQDAAAGSGPGGSTLGSPNLQLNPPPVPPPTGSFSAPTPLEVQSLVQTFMTHASQLGLFLNPSRLLRAISLPRGAPGATDDALLNAVFLWGSRLSSSNTLRSKEAFFCSNAVQAVSGTTLTAQSTMPAAGVISTVQTEVLLSNYFLATGRILEGKYHGLAAVALVTGCRLHQLNVVALARAGIDPTTIGEQIRAFWTVFSLEKVWSAALNTPPTICQRGRAGISITTPWPLDPEAYEQGVVIPRHGYNYHIHDYCQSSGPDESGEDFSRLAFRVKAAALYESALYLSSQYRHDMPNRGEYLAQFTALDTHIESYHRQIATYRNRSSDDMRELLVCRTLACASVIQLHSAFATHQPVSRQKSLTVAVASARALDIVDTSQIRHLDPIVAMLWFTICNVLLDELRRLRHSAVSLRQEDSVRTSASLDRIINAMTSLAYSGPLMASKLQEIQQARSALN